MDWMLEGTIQFLAWARDFSLLQTVQSSSGSHPASYSIAVRMLSPEAKAAEPWSQSLTPIWY
jgi:hypothetical protein